MVGSSRFPPLAPSIMNQVLVEKTLTQPSDRRAEEHKHAHNRLTRPHVTTKEHPPAPTSPGVQSLLPHSCIVFMYMTLHACDDVHTSWLSKWTAVGPLWPVRAPGSALPR
jgi:hypothetical protein